MGWWAKHAWVCPLSPRQKICNSKNLRLEPATHKSKSLRHGASSLRGASRRAPKFRPPVGGLGLNPTLGSPGRTRTYNQLVTLIPKFPLGVDYIITRANIIYYGVRGASLKQFLAPLLPYGIVSEPSRHFLRVQESARLGC